MHFPPTLKIWETGSETSSYRWWKKEIRLTSWGPANPSQVGFYRISSINRILSSTPLLLTIPSSHASFALLSQAMASIAALEPEAIASCHVCACFKKKAVTRWWFQPIWKILGQNGNLPQAGMKIKTTWKHHLENIQHVQFSQTKHKVKD